MVSARLEGRVKSMERDMGSMRDEMATMKEDINQVQIFMMEMRDAKARRKDKGKEVEGVHMGE